MKIDLTRLTINFPEEPTNTWEYSPDRIFYDYRVFGFSGNREVGYVNVSLCGIANSEKNDFWFEKRGRIFIPRPVAVFQNTDEKYRGKGISGQLLILVNQFVKDKYKASLASDTTFCPNIVCDWQERGFSSEKPAMRVWEKLEKRGLTYRRDCNGLARWLMR